MKSNENNHFRRRFGAHDLFSASRGCALPRLPLAMFCCPSGAKDPKPNSGSDFCNEFVSQDTRSGFIRSNWEGESRTNPEILRKSGLDRVSPHRARTYETASRAIALNSF